MTLNHTILRLIRDLMAQIYNFRLFSFVLEQRYSDFLLHNKEIGTYLQVSLPAIFSLVQSSCCSFTSIHRHYNPNRSAFCHVFL